MLQVNQIGFAYTEDQPTLHNISFQVEKGQHVAIIGESGCGKSTLLHLIFGNLDLKEGEIFWNDKKVLGPAYQLIPGLDDVKLLTQEFDLMPFTSVEENVKKHLSRMYPEENEKICKDLLKTVDLLDLTTTKVKYLSGGQKQRVALAQALAKKPNLILLDEPFSHIDQYKKNQLRRDLFAYLKKEGITCLFATHDSKDMLSFSDKTLILDQGKMIDFRSPEKLYRNPKSYKVASLFEEVSLISGKYLGGEAKEKYVVYPHEIILNASTGKLEARVKKVFFMADRYLVSLETEQQQLFAYHHKTISVGKKVSVDFSIENRQDRALN